MALLDSSENLLRAKRNGSNTQNVWDISSLRMEWPPKSVNVLSFCRSLDPKPTSSFAAWCHQTSQETSPLQNWYKRWKVTTTPSRQRSWSATNFTLNPGESVATFVSELRTLAQTCNFGDFLGDMLRDQLVCGINDDYIQRRLACGVCRVGCSHRAGDEIFVELSTKPLSWISIQPQGWISIQFQE